MAKAPILSDISNIPTAATTINLNNEAIKESFENTLSLDGSTPNAMEADLDMNSNDILNAGNISATNLVVNGEDLSLLVDAAVDASVAAALDADAAAASAAAAAADAAIVGAIADELPDPKGVWLTATVYEKGDIVSINGGSEICLIAHTSGVFATDKSNGRWMNLASQGASGGGTGDMLAAQNLNDVVSKPTARTNLGLGSIATQVASAVAITGGTIVGITDLAVADGGTGASDAATARVNLGAQPLEADLTAIAALAGVGFAVRTAADTWAQRSIAAGIGVSITNADGQAGNPTISSGARVPLASKTASGSAQLDFTEFVNANYRYYEFEFENVKPATDAVSLTCRVSTNGGVGYDAGASDYTFSGIGTDGATSSVNGLAANNAMRLSNVNDVGNAAAELGVTGTFKLFHAGTSGTHTRFVATLSYDNPATALTVWTSTGKRLTNQDTDGIRFFFSTGNIASGTIRMYGISA